MNDTHSEDSFSTRAPLIVLILSLSIIFSAIVSSYFRYSQTLSDYQWVNHTNVVKGELSNLKNLLFETATRTYLLTGDKKYKGDLEKGYQKCINQLDTIRHMISDNNEQVADCDTLKDLMATRYSIQAKLINDKETGNDSLLFTDATVSRSVTDSILGIINRMTDIESGLLVLRTDEAENGGKKSALFLVVASAISFFFILFTYLMMVRAYKNRLLMQDELSQNIRELNRSNGELEQFAYVASHDLQEPLRKLRTFSNMLQVKERERLSDEGKELLDRMQSFGARMQRLIEDLLTFSKMINKEAVTAPVNLNRLIGEIKSSFADSTKDKNLVIRFENLPVINGYESQLTQLFQNLISNSIKYSKADGDVQIDISASVVNGALITNVLDKDRKAQFYKVDIKDNGIGFDNQYSEKIFIIFQRLHGKGEYEGTGIGLAICKRVVENHKGYIVASSELGIGTTISVYLLKN